jgi:hypothetical protein
LSKATRPTLLQARRLLRLLTAPVPSATQQLPLRPLSLQSQHFARRQRPSPLAAQPTLSHPQAPRRFLSLPSAPAQHPLPHQLLQLLELPLQVLLRPTSQLHQLPPLALFKPTQVSRLPPASVLLLLVSSLCSCKCFSAAISLSPDEPNDTV